MIIHDYTPPTITTDGAHFSIIPHEYPYRRSSIIRVGSRSFRTPGPVDDADAWQRARRAGQFFQECATGVYPHAIIRVRGSIDIHVYRATERDLGLLNHTFPLVPPDHLQRVVEEKSAGFRIVNTAGRGGSASYMGGLNPAFDDRNTAYDERQSIQITYGALWENRRLNMCPTVLHEIGHVMTHGNNGLNISAVDPERFRELGGVRVSRNVGRLEALCNAYMYFLCYGSTETAVHHYGRGASIQKDQRTRNALRECPAFTRLDETWRNRFNER